MRVTAIVAAPIRVELDLPGGLSNEEIKARIVERAHWLAANNGLTYEILDCSRQDLANHEVVNSLPLIPWIEYVLIEAECSEAAHLSASGICETDYDESYATSSGDWPD